MRVTLDLDEEALAEPARELWSISQEEADYEGPEDIVASVQEVITTLEEWVSRARAKAGRWLS